MKKNYFWIVLILIAATLLRISHNVGISIWHDEAFSALMIRYPWGEMFRRLAMDVHPPMYYIALRFWFYAFGDGMWALRGFSVLFGVLTVWAGWLFTKQAFKSEKMALYAAVLLAISPFGLSYSTEARMYTFGAFFAVLGAYFLVRALHEQKNYFDDKKLNMPNLPQDIKLRKNYLWHYLWFVVCTAIIILTHYYLFFTAAALCLYALIYHVYHYRSNYRRYLLLATSYILICISFLPWLKKFLGQLKSVGQSYWIPDMTWWSIPSTLWSILLGFADDVTKQSTDALLIITLLFTIYFLWRFIRRTDQFEKWLVALALVMPFIGAVLFYLKSVTCAHTGVNGMLMCHGRSVYEDRYFLFAAVFYTIALAGWLAEIKNKTIGAVLFVIYVLVNIVAIRNYWASLNLPQSPGMNGAAKYLGSNVGPDQHVFLGTSFEFFNYKYYQEIYYPTPLPPLLYTGGRSDVSQMSAVEGSALLSNSDLAANFTQGVKSGDTEWLIWTYAFGSSKPQLPANWVQVDEESFPDVRPYVGTTIYVDEYKVN